MSLLEAIKLQIVHKGYAKQERFLMRIRETPPICEKSYRTIDFSAKLLHVARNCYM